MSNQYKHYSILFHYFISVFIFLCTGCSHTLDDYHEEGQGVIRSLIQELQAIYTHQQLLEASAKLQNDFDRLVDIMIAARQLSLNKVDHTENETKNRYDLSDQLRIELNRIYQIEGGRQIIEKLQERALFRLDAYEKSRLKHV